MLIRKCLVKKGGKKALDTYDNNIKRIFDQIDMEANPYIGKPEGTKGYIGKSLKKAFGLIPYVFRSLSSDVKTIVDNYLNHTQEFTNAIDEVDQSQTFDKIVEDFMDHIEFLMSDMTPPIFAGMFAQQSIKKMFKGDDVDSDITALNMNLDGNPTSEMGVLLFKIAGMDEFKATLSRDEFIQSVAHRKYSGIMMKMIDDYVSLYGARGFKEIDVASKRVSEDMGILYEKIVQVNTSANQIQMVETKREEAYQRLLILAKEKGKEEQYIKAAAKFKGTFGYREYPKYLMVKAFGILHELCLDIGNSWVKEKRLDEAYHIFDLCISDIAKAQNNQSYDLREVRSNHLIGYRKVSHIEDWPLVIDSRGKIHKPELDINESDIVGASIAPPGKVVGKAKVLHSPYEKPLEPGEILIVKATEPSWTPIFTNAAGVVMEIGGPLQHGGIIAREYGIPCVSGLVGIMDIIKDGDMVEVDGNNGLVRLL